MRRLCGDARTNRARNYIGGERLRSLSSESTEIFDPANLETLAHVAMADANDVASAVSAASAAFPGWRRTPVQTRVQDLFKFKQLLEKNADHMACLTTRENGKILLKHRRNCGAGSKTSKSRVACL